MYCRERGRHGGCAIFFKQGMQFTDRIDFKNLNVSGSFECCASQVIIGSDKYLIICIYRPNTLPLSNIEIFFEKLMILLDKCKTYKFIIVIINRQTYSENSMACHITTGTGFRFFPSLPLNLSTILCELEILLICLNRKCSFLVFPI